MTELTHLSLFTGIGGLDLAAEWAGFTTVGQCEFADYPTKVLEKHWPDVPRWSDIRTLTGESFYERTGLRTVDVVSGGFPCQPFSVAGRQRGKDDSRYLWPEMLRIVRELTPRWVVGENVPGILNIAADGVCADMERAGYDVWIFDFEAAAVGAPHRRERIAFVAHAKSERPGETWSDRQRPSKRAAGLCFMANANRGGCGEPKVQGKQSWGAEAVRASEVVADTVCIGSATGVADQEKWQKGKATKPYDSGEAVADTDSGGFNGIRQSSAQRCDGDKIDTSISKSCLKADSESADVEGWNGNFASEQAERPRKGQPAATRCTDVPDAACELCKRNRGARGWWPEPANGGWWAVEPDVGRVANGVPARVDRLKCLGNAVVPQQFYPIFKAIREIEEESRGFKP